jgi:hypothetical protein
VRLLCWVLGVGLVLLACSGDALARAIWVLDHGRHRRRRAVHERRVSLLAASPRLVRGKLFIFLSRLSCETRTTAHAFLHPLAQSLYHVLLALFAHSLTRPPPPTMCRRPLGRPHSHPLSHYVRARSLNLEVWLDLHAAPGSQNGFDNSGRLGPLRWDRNVTYVERTVRVASRLAQAVRTGSSSAPGTLISA